MEEIIRNIPLYFFNPILDRKIQRKMPLENLKMLTLNVKINSVFDFREINQHFSNYAQ